MASVQVLFAALEFAKRGVVPLCAWRGVVIGHSQVHGVYGVAFLCSWSSAPIAPRNAASW